MCGSKPLRTRLRAVGRRQTRDQFVGKTDTGNLPERRRRPVERDANPGVSLRTTFSARAYASATSGRCSFIASSYKIINWAAILLNISRVGSPEEAIRTGKKEAKKNEGARRHIGEAIPTCPYGRSGTLASYSNMPVNHEKRKSVATGSLLSSNHLRLTQVHGNDATSCRLHCSNHVSDHERERPASFARPQR